MIHSSLSLFLGAVLSLKLKQTLNIVTKLKILSSKSYVASQQYSHCSFCFFLISNIHKKKTKPPIHPIIITESSINTKLYDHTLDYGWATYFMSALDPSPVKFVQCFSSTALVLGSDEDLRVETSVY